MQVEYEVMPITKEFFSIYHVLETTWDEDEAGRYALNSRSEIVATYDTRQAADLEALKQNILARDEGLRS